MLFIVLQPVGHGGLEAFRAQLVRAKPQGFEGFAQLGGVVLAFAAPLSLGGLQRAVE